MSDADPKLAASSGPTSPPASSPTPAAIAAIGATANPVAPVTYGDFPFPLTHGAAESPFLTWWRNHSNYMAVGGWLDYLRIAAVLLRGIFINNLIVVPPLLFLALALSLSNDWLETGGHMSPYVLAAVIAWIFLFPVAMLLTKIARYQRSLASGSDSSVRSRDLYERTFAIALLLLIAVVVIELLPFLLRHYHRLRLAYGGDLPWKEYLGGATLGLGALSAAPKLIEALKGWWKKLAIVSVALVGVLAPLLVIVVVADFLLYPPLFGRADDKIAAPVHLAVILAIPPLVYVLGIAIVAILGALSRTFSRAEYGRLGLILLVLVILHFALLVAVTLLYQQLGADMSVERRTVLANSLFIFASALEALIFCWLLVDINQTSIHGLYRDRLAAAFLLGVDPEGRVAIEDDVPLGELGYRATGSVAPYHLINVALNLQGSDDIGLRDRHSDFFIFSQKFVGSERTGYCRTASLEQVFPQIHLAGAMAISAAAASPNMGRATSPALVAFMTLINVRLGVWIPNPGRVEEHFQDRADKARRRRARIQARAAAKARGEKPESSTWWPFGKKSKARSTARGGDAGFSFAEVFAGERVSLGQRWVCLGAAGQGRAFAAGRPEPTPSHGLAGLAFSGGGIRSAAFNLGIAQALHEGGLFRHFDYLSTVSGGGYLGSAISTVMRYRTLPASEIDGTVTVAPTGDGGSLVTVTAESGGETKAYRYTADAELMVKTGDSVRRGGRLIGRQGRRLHAEIAGTVALSDGAGGRQVVTVTGTTPAERREYVFTAYDEVDVAHGQAIEAGRLLVKPKNSFGERFRWRVRPWALLAEMLMRLNERGRWVNLSDGGHIENLATLELLRRRCRVIVIGDGEADPDMHFAGLATLMRTARIDLGIEIDLHLGDLRLGSDRYCRDHLAIGRISYPGDPEPGFLLYLKSSVTGDEDEVVAEYRNRSTSFPHESTADQFFNEGQFEAYRALGEHVGQCAIKAIAPHGAGATGIAYDEFAKGVAAFWKRKSGGA